MIIQHNLMAMNASRQLGLTTGKLAKRTEKLSSGYRINRSADDAAGLAISEKMRRQIRGLTQASANCQDGISLVQIADGALKEIHDMLHRASELSIHAANDTLTYEDRQYIQQEVSALISEIDGISDRATFNEIKVLQGHRDGYAYRGDGSAYIVGGLPSFITDNSPDLQAGHLTGEYSNGGKKYASGMVNFSGVNESNLDQLDGQGFNMTCATCDRHYSVRFTSDASPAPVHESSGMHHIYSVSTDGVTNGEQLVDRIIDAMDGGNPDSHFTHLFKDGYKLMVYDDRGVDENNYSPGSLDSYKNRSMLLPGIAKSTDELPENRGVDDLLIQVGAESGQYISIKLPAISSKLLEIDRVSVTSQGSASYAIESFKNALSYVSEERSRMGSYQNRLEHTIKNLDNVVENTSRAESQIRDADMATEMVGFSNAQILSQAGQSMLSQANQSSQGIMSILQ